MLCTWNRAIVYRSKGLLIGWLQREEHFETVLHFFICAKGAVEMLKTYRMFREGPKEEKRKRLRGGTFRKTSQKTDAVVSHSGTHSQRYVINVSHSFLSLVLTKLLSNDYKVREV